MFPSNALLSFVFIYLTAVDAIPLSRRDGGQVTIPLHKGVSESGMLKLIETDRARARSLHNNDHLEKGSTSFNITNSASFYTTEVGVGSPATKYTLLIDSGSANTWVGAQASNPYTPTSTSHDTGDRISIRYGSGNFTGEEWTDTITIAPSLVVENQSIGVANNTGGFAGSGIDGILGVGPIDITNGTVTNTGLVPTVLDNLYNQGKIPEEVIGIFFAPSSEQPSNGTLTFGGVDDSVITNPVKYVPRTKTSRASRYWGIDLSVKYGDAPILSATTGVVDTGTTLVLIATDAFQIYQNATGGVLDPNTGLLVITEDQYSALQPLSFNIGDASYDLSPNAQIWPRSLNAAIGGNSTAIYLIVGDLGPLSSKLQFDALVGYAFLERYYSVYDTTNQRIGLAPTAYTTATTN